MTRILLACILHTALLNVDIVEADLRTSSNLPAAADDKKPPAVSYCQSDASLVSCQVSRERFLRNFEASGQKMEASGQKLTSARVGPPVEGCNGGITVPEGIFVQHLQYKCPSKSQAYLLCIRHRKSWLNALLRNCLAGPTASKTSLLLSDFSL